MNAKSIVDSIIDLITSGSLAFLVAFIVAMKPKFDEFIKAKSSAERMSVLNDVAKSYVAQYSTHYELPGDQKKDRAVLDTRNAMEAKGYSLNPKLYGPAVERAYQAMSTQDTAAQAKQTAYKEKLNEQMETSPHAPQLQPKSIVKQNWVSALQSATNQEEIDAINTAYQRAYTDAPEDSGVEHKPANEKPDTATDTVEKQIASINEK